MIGCILSEDKYMRLSLINDFYFEVELSGKCCGIVERSAQKGGRDITGDSAKREGGEHEEKPSRISFIAEYGFYF
jgi:hypothetical protein